MHKIVTALSSDTHRWVSVVGDAGSGKSTCAKAAISWMAKRGILGAVVACTLPKDKGSACFDDFISAFASSQCIANAKNSIAKYVRALVRPLILLDGVAVHGLHQRSHLLGGWSTWFRLRASCAPVDCVWTANSLSL